MLALIYFWCAVSVGDFFCRHFYRFVSVTHRCAAAVLVGLLISTWFTYLAGLAFAWTSRPLLWANLLFFLAVLALLTWPKWKHGIVKAAPDAAHCSQTAETYVARPNGSGIADWLLIAGYVILVSWMMFASFNISGSRLRISNPEYSDFGPNTAIMQSFAVGHNFPTEYPHFSGDRIRYHFLFYFQAGNLEFLGLDPAWSLNLLSITTLVAMLIVVMTLGEVLFNSRAVGRFGSLLFFFFGSLSYVPFLQRQGSVRAAMQAIRQQREFLPSVFPYRGEQWGTWSQVTYLNQRHFASAIGILLLVLVFLIIQYRAQAAPRRKPLPSTDTVQPDALVETPPVAVSEILAESQTEPASVSVAIELKAQSIGTAESFHSTVPGFIFSGVLLGLIPMWNSAVFIAAAAVLGLLCLLFPLRLRMLALAVTAGVIGMPQIVYLTTGSGRAPMPQLLHWGYTLDNPTTLNVAKYLGFTFGFKWLLLALALVFATGLQRRLFVAVLSLLAVAFCFQFSTDVLTNQKFLHIWVIIANLFVAFALWRLWRFSLGGTTLPAKFVAAVFFLLVIPGGIIDFFPIHNTGWIEVTYRNDALIEWLEKNTTPRDIFLTDTFVNHPILMAGRRVFYGWPYYLLGHGHDARKRGRVYAELFESRDAWKVFQLLKQNNIRYAAFDNAVRSAQFLNRSNEEVYATYFPKVFEDNRYNGLILYKVPDTPPPSLSALPQGK
jgi:hypothetical protein